MNGAKSILIHSGNLGLEIKNSNRLVGVGYSHIDKGITYPES